MFVCVNFQGKLNRSSVLFKEIIPAIIEPALPELCAEVSALLVKFFPVVERSIQPLISP